MLLTFPDFWPTTSDHRLIIIKIHESRAGAPVNLLSVREKVSKAAKSSQISVPASPNAFKTVGLFSKNKKINALDQVPTNYRNLKQLVCNVLTVDLSPYFPTYFTQPAEKLAPPWEAQ